MSSAMVEMIGGPLDGQRKLIPLGWGNQLAPDAWLKIPVIIGPTKRIEMYRMDGPDVARYEGQAAP